MQFMTDGPGDAALSVLLAHGAGTPMDHPFLEAVARGMADAGYRVVRFEFPYMAARRSNGKRPPPDREPVLLETFHAAFESLDGPVVVGGKSMGGRMASMAADDLGAAGLLVFGYPFHPPGRPERLRTAHLAGLRTPALIIQGTNDSFGTREDVAGYTLSPSIRIDWVEGAGHDLTPASSSRLPLATRMAGPIESAVVFLRGLRPKG
jgi:predicted alpha/beta-hydrolase family hydrolase